jgi:hypothetical protein
MSVRLVKNLTEGIIEMGHLQDGQIAIVLSEQYAGRIVQRYANSGVVIGSVSIKGWHNIEGNTLLVRVLTTGELIEII